MRRCIFNLAAFAALAVAPARAAEIPQWHGLFGGPPEFTTTVLRDAPAWAGFWKQAGQDQPRPLEPGTEMAVAVFIGERRTGGYTVKIVSAALENDHLVVGYAVEAPAPGRITAQVITSPWAVAVVPRTGRAVIFRPTAR